MASSGIHTKKIDLKWIDGRQSGSLSIGCYPVRVITTISGESFDYHLGLRFSKIRVGLLSMKTAPVKASLTNLPITPLRYDQSIIIGCQSCFLNLQPLKVFDFCTED